MRRMGIPTLGPCLEGEGPACWTEHLATDHKVGTQFGRVRDDTLGVESRQE